MVKQEEMPDFPWTAYFLRVTLHMARDAMTITLALRTEAKNCRKFS